MEKNCKNCKNAIEENSVYYCKVLKVPEYEEDGNLSIGQYKVVDPNINFHCKQFETKIKA
jgi:hypothetical protein